MIKNLDFSIICCIFVLNYKTYNMTDAEIKLKVFNYYSDNTCSCKNCGISDLRVLCLDHVDSNGNIHRKNGGKKGINLYKSLYRHNFISDYNFQVLCANCNMIKFFENKESSHSKNEVWKNKISKSLKGRIAPKGIYSYRARKVAQYDINLNFIKVWDVIKEAEYFYNKNLKSKNIVSCCTGRQKTAYGFIWKYYNN